MPFVACPSRGTGALALPPRTQFCPRCVRVSAAAPRAAPRARRTRVCAQAEGDPDGVSARVRAELAADGVNLDELLNAARVVSLTRQLDALSLALSRSGGDDDAALAALSAKRDRLQRELAAEKRQVMGVFMKRVFLVQALVFGALGGVLAFDAVPGRQLPVVAQALGFWMIWLFTIPALRARKGIRGFEKSALNIAFLATPFVNVGMAAVTRECGIIWAIDAAVLAALYLYYGVQSAAVGDEGEEKETAKVRGVLRYLDWGSWR